MAASTTWTPAPWLTSQTWLLKDNTVVKTPEMEESSSGRRVRIKGESKSFPKGDVDQLMRDAIEKVARERGTERWVIITDRDTNNAWHGAASPDRGRMPDFTASPSLHYTDPNLINNASAHTDIVFEFASEECPNVTAMVWVYLGKARYGSSYVIKSGITYRNMFQDHWNDASGYQFWSPGTKGWWDAYTNYSHDAGDDREEDTEAFLSAHVPIPGIEWVNQEFTSARSTVAAALKLAKELVNVEKISLPVWRDRSMPEAMTYKATGRTTFSNSLYREMLEFVQTKATVERIRHNYEQILRDMRALGMVTEATKERNFFQAVEDGLGHDLVCHTIPVRLDDEEPVPGHPESVTDEEHTVSIDFKSGTLVVNCHKDSSGIVEQWNFARFEAELKGELDSFLGFARQATQKRSKKRLEKIVNSRHTDDTDLEIEKFSSGVKA